MLSAVKEGEIYPPHRALGIIDNSKAKNNNFKNMTELNTKTIVRCNLYLLVMQLLISHCVRDLYSQTCVKQPYKTRHMLGFSDRWWLFRQVVLLIAA